MTFRKVQKHIVKDHVKHNLLKLHVHVWYVHVCKGNTFKKSQAVIYFFTFINLYFLYCLIFYSMFLLFYDSENTIKLFCFIFF